VTPPHQQAGSASAARWPAGTKTEIRPSSGTCAATWTAAPVQRDLYGRRCAGWLAGGRAERPVRPGRGSSTGTPPRRQGATRWARTQGAVA